MSARTSPKMRTESKRLFVQGLDPERNPESALGSTYTLAEANARDLANTRSCPTGHLNYEPMFVQKEKKSSRAAARAADAIDLLIEFATLGEYGLEYPEPVRSGSRKTTTPEITMHRQGAGHQKHRHSRRPCRPGRTRVDLPGWTERPGHEIPGAQPGRRHKAKAHADARLAPDHRHRPTAALPDVLRPPRIRLEAI